MSKEQKIVLLRPQKTGSESLTVALKDRYQKAGKFCHLLFAFQYESLPSYVWDHFTFFWPHLSVVQGQHYVPGAKYISVVRDPRKRLLSTYFFWREVVDEGNRKFGPSAMGDKISTMSLKEFLTTDDEDVLRGSDNYLTRFFGGGEYGRTREDRTQIYLPEGQTMEETYHIAIKNIDEVIDVVAVVEKFRDSLLVLQDLVGHALPIERDIHVNATKSKYHDQDVDEECEELISNRIKFDSLIYEYCLKKLEDQLNALAKGERLWSRLEPLEAGEKADLGAGKNFHAQGRLADAERTYRAFLADNPSHAEVHHLLGLLLSQSGRKKEAVETLERAAELKPENAGYHRDVGVARFQAGRENEGMESLRRAVELAPGDSAIAINLIRALMHDGRSEEAIGYLRPLAASDPANAEVQETLAQALELVGRHDESRTEQDEVH